MVEILDGCHFRKIENRIVQQQAMTLTFGRVQQVAFRADETLDRHHDFFADRIDRRVGDLSKQLLEVIVQQTGLVAQASQCHVVAH